MYLDITINSVSFQLDIANSQPGEGNSQPLYCRTLEKIHILQSRAGSFRVLSQTGKGQRHLLSACCGRITIGHCASCLRWPPCPSVFDPFLHFMTTDNPSSLLIDNCSAADFEYLCPKTWASLRPGHVENVRHCDVCRRNVYMCRTDQDLRMYDSLGYCIAISPQQVDDRRRAATVPSADEPSVPPAESAIPERLPLVGYFRKK